MVQCLKICEGTLHENGRDGVGHFHAKSPLTNFQTLNHQTHYLLVYTL